ncbi:MAG: hypothetical protein WBE45_09550, partial [Terriglobales bacterium]
MKILREIVAEQMVEVHRISPELAAYHVRQMMPSEVKRRFLFYVRRVSGPIFRVAQGAIGNLTINGMENRAGKPFELFAHAGSREFPGEVEGLAPRKFVVPQKFALAVVFVFAIGFAF